MTLVMATDHVNPLNIAEIVAIVVHYLDGEWKTLVAYAQVKNLWNQEAVAILWKQLLCWRGWSSLAYIIPYRAQTHTKHIRYLPDLDFPDGNKTRLFSSLSFPQLHGASFTIPTRPDEIYLLQYLVPSLRRLQINDGFEYGSHKAGNNVIDYLSDEFYVQIQVYDSLLLPPQL